MARVSEIGFATEAGEPVLGRIYLSYVERLHLYVALAVIAGDHDLFPADSAVVALSAARQCLMGRGLRYVGEAPATGTRILRVVRFTGVASVSDQELSIPLEEDDLRELAGCQNPVDLHSFLTRTLANRLLKKHVHILESWLRDPECSWALLPADAQKATSVDIDFDVDESFLSFVRNQHDMS